jgi:phage tail-like protein
MTVQGQPTVYHHKYRFIVEIDDFASAAFMKCSPLKATNAVVETWEGGSLIAHKEPGRTTYDNVTLERGVTNNEDAYDWFKDVVKAYKNSGRGSPHYFRNLDIVQLARSGIVMRRWTLEEAFPTEFIAGEWDNESDESVVETLTLAYKLFKKPSD